METIKPAKLKFGDTIGIISPSGRLNDEGKQNLSKGIRFLESLGFKVKIGKNALNQYYYSAGTPEERASDLQDMFLDPEVKAVFQSQGGQTANEILEHLNWDIIRGNPKLFGGMSDGSTLALAIYAKTGITTLHGPDVVWGYGREITEYEKNSLIKILTTGEIGEIVPNPDHRISNNAINSSQTWKCWRQGKAKGKLLGGNLSVIERLHGTEHGPEYIGSILFLEDIGHPAKELASKFTHLKLTGILDKVSGVILGYFDQNRSDDPSENRPIGEVFTEATKNYSFPVLEIGEIGHNTANTNLPIGITAKIDTDNLKFEILETALS